MQITKQNIGKELKRIHSENPDNIMAAVMCEEDKGRIDRLVALPDDEFEKALAIIRTGIENEDSHVGAYAMNPSDYETFDWILAPIVEKYHKVDSDFTQKEDWNLKGDFDLLKIDSRLKDLSLRARVARNIEGYPLPGAMSKEDRVEFEKEMFERVFKKSIEKFGGRYYSITPGSDHEISREKYEELVAEHKMFKNMDKDPYLNVAGISSDWPYGRGMYESEHGRMIIWVGEEDHLRIISMDQRTDLRYVFEHLRQLLDAVEDSGLNFAKSKRFGNVTSCPSNLGTGMRASVHIPLPNLVKNEKNMKAIAKNYGLSIRGIGGEHTAYGEDGMVDVSPSARLGVTEAEVLQKLFDGLSTMLEEEKKALATA